MGLLLFVMAFGAPSLYVVCRVLTCPSMIGSEADVFLAILIGASLGLLASLRMEKAPAVKAALLVPSEGEVDDSRSLFFFGSLVMIVIARICLLLAHCGIFPEVF